jgi:hypothetical protein
MQQIAIDLGGRKSQVCARSSDGEIVEERSCETRSLRAYLRQRLAAGTTIMARRAIRRVRAVQRR